MNDIVLNFSNLQLRRILYTRRFFALAVAMMSVAGVLILLLIFMQIPSIFDMQGHLKDERTTLANLQKKVSALDEFSSGQGIDRQHKVDIALPSQKPLLQLLSNTNSVAQQVGVTVVKIDTAPGKLATAGAKPAAGSSLDASPPVTPAPVNSDAPVVAGAGTLTIGLKLQGTLIQINNFSNTIEKFMPLTDITQIRLTNLRDRSDQSLDQSNDKFDADLMLTTYYFNQTVATTVDTPIPDLGTPEQTFLNALNTFTFQEITPQKGIEGGGQIDLFGITGQ